jgi:hypothetical protein
VEYPPFGSLGDNHIFSQTHLFLQSSSAMERPASQAVPSRLPDGRFGHRPVERKMAAPNQESASTSIATSLKILMVIPPTAPNKLSRLAQLPIPTHDDAERHLFMVGPVQGRPQWSAPHASAPSRSSRVPTDPGLLRGASAITRSDLPAALSSSSRLSSSSVHLVCCSFLA